MRTNSKVALAVAAVMLGLAGAEAASARPTPAVPMIVAFERTSDNVIERLARAGITHAALYRHAHAAAVIGPRSAYRTIARWSDVARVYRARTFRPQSFQTKRQIGADDVLAGAAPLRSSYTGEGVTVAVLDTGIESTHPDFGDRVARNLVFDAGALDAIADGAYSEQPPETPTGVDDVAHGTLVAGVLAGDGRSAMGADMRGVAPDATLINAKFSDLGSLAYTPGLLTGDHTTDAAPNLIYESAILAAYEWLIDHRNDAAFPGGIRVVNNSYGGVYAPGQEPIALTRIYRRAIELGMVIVVAAGNEGPEPRSVTYPGTLSELITVGGNCKVPHESEASCSGGVARLSGRGPALDVVAPAVHVWGPIPHISPVGLALMLPNDQDPTPPGAGDPDAERSNRLWYSWVLGTSIASPQVAGVVAAMLEANPGLTHRQVERILQRTATDQGPEGFDEDFGYGQVDALAAVRRAEVARGAAPRRSRRP